MSDQEQAATDTSVQSANETKATPPPAPSAPAAKADERDPEWINARLERERKTLLKSIGVDSEEAAKKAVAELKAREEAAKTLEQKAAEQAAALIAKENELVEARKANAEYAARQMLGLTAEQKAAVIALAGEDPTKQLSTIAALSPTWAKAEQQTQAADPAAKTPKPATTAPARSAPDGTQTSQPNHRATYEHLKDANPFAAARYGLEHAAEVYRTKG